MLISQLSLTGPTKPELQPVPSANSTVPQNSQVEQYVIQKIKSSSVYSIAIISMTDKHHAKLCYHFSKGCVALRRT